MKPLHQASRPYLRATIKLAALFLFATFGTAGARYIQASTAYASPVPPTIRQLKGTPGDVYPRLKPGTEGELSDAFAPQVAAATIPMYDAFSDRANLAGLPAPVAVSAVNVAARGGNGSAAPQIPSVPDFNARLASRSLALRRGEAVPPVNSLYTYDELKPIGVIGGGATRDALMYASPSRQTFAAKLGTQFYDCQLVAITEDGVKFMTKSGAVRPAAWAKPAANAPTRQAEAAPIAPIAPVVIPNTGTGAPGKTAFGTNTDVSLQDAVRERYSAPAESNPAVPTSSVSFNPNSAPQGFNISPAALPRSLTLAESAPASSSGLHFNHPNLFFRSTSARQPIEDSNGLGSESLGTPSETSAHFNVAPQQQELAKPQQPQPGSSLTQPAAPAPVPAPTTAPVNKPLEALAPPTSQGREMVPAPAGNRQPVQQKPKAALSFCDPDFVGEAYTLETVGATTTVGILINDLHFRYGVNFMPDADVIDLSAPISVSGAPWKEVLQTILDYNDLEAVCTPSGIVRIAKRAKISQIRDARRKSEPVYTKLYSLRYLQTTSAGSVDLAGRTSGTKGGTIESLEVAVREILRAAGDPRAEVRKVPGRNEFFISATGAQHQDIDRLIAQADKPPSQVSISISIYTINRNQSIRLGTEFSAILGNANGSRFGGVSTQPGQTATTGTGTGTGSGTGNTTLQPGGVANLLGGFLQPSGALAAANPLFSAGVTSIFGTAQFSAQFTAAKQKGLLFEKYSPVLMVADGETVNLNSGTQFPVVIPALVGGGSTTGQTAGNIVFVQAGRIASVVPQVALDANGKPDYVTLQLRLENNSVDGSLAGLGSAAPPVNRQSIETVVRLRDNQTVVVGGFTLDSDSDQKQQVPGLAQIPGLGNLFKNKNKQTLSSRLYYAISVRVIPQDEMTPPIPLPADVKAREQQLKLKEEKVQP